MPAEEAFGHPAPPGTGLQPGELVPPREQRGSRRAWSRVRGEPVRLRSTSSVYAEVGPCRTTPTTATQVGRCRPAVPPGGGRSGRPAVRAEQRHIGSVVGSIIAATIRVHPRRTRGRRWAAPPAHRPGARTPRPTASAAATSPATEATPARPAPAARACRPESTPMDQRWSRHEAESDWIALCLRTRR